MRKYLIILVGILLLAAACQKQPDQNEVLAGITVTSPISGQKLENDSEYEISWIRNNPSGGLLSIDLVSTDGADRMYKITYAAPKENKKQGKLKWKVLGIQPGKYKIYIYAPINCAQGGPSCKPIEGYSGEILIGNRDTQNLPEEDKTSWQTYANSLYGFEIKYPNDFVLYTNVNKMKIVSYIPVCNPDMVACLMYSKDKQKNTNLEGAGVSIDVLKDLGTEASCLIIREGEEKTDRIAIFGVNFDVYKGGGAVAGHSEEYWNYRTFNNTHCYQVTLRTTEANLSNFDPSTGIKVYDWNAVRTKQEQVLSTFKFLSSDQTTVKVFFAPKNSSQDQCDDVVAVERTPVKISKIATAALEELLKGPTLEEKKQGYSSAIPAGSKLNSLSIVNGEARADFNQNMQSGGGSCSMGIRTAQIRNTLMQFGTVQKVKISINGSTENIFQP